MYSRIRLFWISPWLLHIIAVDVHDIVHTSKRMLIKGSVVGPLERWIHYDIVSRLPNDVVDVHDVHDGLHTTLDYLDQVLKDQSRQVDLVVCLDLMHEPIVDLAYSSMLRPYGLEKV